MELDTRTKAVIEALAQQRNASADMICNLNGELADMREKLAAAEKKIAELEKNEVPPDVLR